MSAETDDIELAQWLSGVSNRKEDPSDDPGATKTVYGIATSDSENGVVYTDLEGTTVSGSGEQSVPLTATCAVKSGQRVIITLVNNDPIVTGVAGWGDEVNQKAAAAEALAKDSVKNVEVEYAVGDSQDEAPTTGWSTSTPEWTSGKYIWQRTVIHTTESTSYSDPTCIQGAAGESGAQGDRGTSVLRINNPFSGISQRVIDGKLVNYSMSVDTIKSYADVSDVFVGDICQYSGTLPVSDVKVTRQWPIIVISDGKAYAYEYIDLNGSDGATGQGVSSITPQYYLSESSSSATGGSWQTSPPEYVRGHYYWTRNEIVWQNPTSTTYTTEVYDPSLTEALSSVVQLKTLIREDETYGVEVGKSEDGTTFSGIHTTMGTEKFAIHAADHTELATFGENKIELGKNSNSAIVSMLNDALKIEASHQEATEYGSGITYGYLSTSDADAIGIQARKQNGSKISNAVSQALISPVGDLPSFNVVTTYNGGSQLKNVNSGTFAMNAGEDYMDAILSVSNGAYSSQSPMIDLNTDPSTSNLTLRSNTLTVGSGSYEVKALMDALVLMIQPHAWRFSENKSGTYNISNGWHDTSSLSHLDAGPTNWSTYFSKTVSSITTKVQGSWRFVDTLHANGKGARIGCGVWLSGKEDCTNFTWGSTVSVTVVSESIYTLNKGTTVTFREYAEGSEMSKALSKSLTNIQIEYLGPSLP